MKINKTKVFFVTAAMIISNFAASASEAKTKTIKINGKEFAGSSIDLKIEQTEFGPEVTIKLSTERKNDQLGSKNKKVLAKKKTDKKVIVVPPQESQKSKDPETKSAESSLLEKDKAIEDMHKNALSLVGQEGEKSEDPSDDLKDVPPTAPIPVETGSPQESGKEQDLIKEEELKKAEESRKAEELKKAEELRKAQALKKAEELRKAQALKKAEELRKAQALKRAEELKKAEELRKAEELKRAEELKKAEALIKAEELRKAEEARKEEELKKAEDLKKTEALKKEKQKSANLTKKEVKKVDSNYWSVMGTVGPILAVKNYSLEIEYGRRQSSIGFNLNRVSMTNSNDVKVEGTEFLINGHYAIVNPTRENHYWARLVGGLGLAKLTSSEQENLPTYLVTNIGLENFYYMSSHISLYNRIIGLNLYHKDSGMLNLGTEMSVGLRYSF